LKKDNILNSVDFSTEQKGRKQKVSTELQEQKAHTETVEKEEKVWKVLMKRNLIH